MVAKGEVPDLPQTFRRGHGKGRPRTPAVFLEWSDAAAAILVACATGKVLKDFEHLPTIKEFAEHSPLALRKEAAVYIIDRRYGKPKESVEIDDVSAPVERILGVIVEPTATEPVTVPAEPKRVLTS